MAKKSMPDSLRKVLAKQGKNPGQAEFIAEIILLAGGPRQLASHMWTEFIKDGASPMFKSRFMDLLLRAMREDDKKRPPAELGDLTDDELSDIVAESVARREEKERAKEADQAEGQRDAGG
jgi:hypothetical protein